MRFDDEEIGGHEPGVAKIILRGVEWYAATLIGQGRYYLGALKKDMELNKLTFGHRVHSPGRYRYKKSLGALYTEGEFHNVVPNYDVLTKHFNAMVNVTYRPVIAVTSNKAMDDMQSIDTIDINVHSHYEILAGEDYTPALWVGVRVLSGTTDGPYFIAAHPMLNIWEPPVKGGEARELSAVGFSIPEFSFGAYTDDTNIPFSMMPRTVTHVGDWHHGTLNPTAPADEIFASNTPNGLLLTSAPYTYDPYFSSQNPQYWQQTAALDRDLTKVTLSASTKMWGADVDGIGYWTGTYGVHDVNVIHDVFRGAYDWEGSYYTNTETQINLTSKIIDGEYAIKLGQFSWDECYANPHTYELKVVLGKPPGSRIETKTFLVKTTTGSNYYKEIYPYGWYYNPDDSPYSGAGSDDNWWQGAIMVDVKNGLMRKADDPEKGDYKLSAEGYQVDGHSPFTGSPVPKHNCMPSCSFHYSYPATILEFNPWKLSGSDIVGMPEAFEYVYGLQGVVTHSEGVHSGPCRGTNLLQTDPDGLYPLGSGMNYPIRQADTSDPLGAGDYYVIVGWDEYFWSWNVEKISAPSGSYGSVLAQWTGARDKMEFQGWVFDVVGSYIVPITNPLGLPVDYVF